jgi:hypothetical protein
MAVRGFDGRMNCNSGAWFALFDVALISPAGGQVTGLPKHP